METGSAYLAGRMAVEVGTLRFGYTRVPQGTLLGRGTLLSRAREIRRAGAGSYAKRRKLEMGLAVSAVSGGLPVNTGDAQVFAWHQARYYVCCSVITLPQRPLASGAGYGGDVVAPGGQSLNQVRRSH